MNRYLLSGFATIAVTALLAVGASPAEAHIEYRGNFQVTKKDGLIATPYCEEENIARVAQSYGIRVTPEEVHRNALTKVYLCQPIGDDSRLKGSCGAYAPDVYGR